MYSIAFALVQAMLRTANPTQDHIYTFGSGLMAMRYANEDILTQWDLDYAATGYVRLDSRYPMTCLTRVVGN